MLTSLVGVCAYEYTDYFNGEHSFDGPIFNKEAQVVFGHAKGRPGQLSSSACGPGTLVDLQAQILRDDIN
ncbi:hypothetical protein RJT34_32592 [Clitoria ternatea]|uniref:Uncharacterized protein n=1 Tax=Clitoria ternatea TaxID=43366 RepID=A0AAN9F4B3_CLITE